MTAAIILAGGLGTRLRSAVPDRPKPMALIRGRPFLEHLLDYWINQGVTRFILSVGYMHEMIMQHFGQQYKSVPVSYAIEEQPLGTGGGLLMAATGLKEPFLVLNGDTFFAVQLKALESFHQERKSDWTFSLFRANHAGRYMGMSTSENGFITSLKSGTDAIGRLANGGVYLINPAAIAMAALPLATKVSLEDDVLPHLMERGCAIFGCESPGSFIDIGVPEDYFRAESVLPT